MDVPRSLIKVQVVPNPEQAGQLGPGRSWEALADRIDEIGVSVGEIAKQLRGQLEASLAESDVAGWRIREVALNFSLDLEAEAGVVVARARTAAGFEVLITWSRT
jgi:hypothetical protein